MTERALLVVRLLRARWDWLPAIRTATGLIVESMAKRGETDQHWFQCPKCGGQGRSGQGRAERQCDRCNGEGRVAGDPYTFGVRSKGAIERERVTGEDENAKLQRQRSLRALRRLELERTHREGRIDPKTGKRTYEDPREREAWEAAKASLYASGSFAELDRALLLLERVDAYGRAAVEVVYGYDSPLRLVGKDLQAAADRGVERVASWMPDPIRVPERDPRGEVSVNGTGRWANASARSARDREIWRLHEVDGLNREQIARRLGIDRSTVSRVLASKVAA